eukprot:3752579-Lingulodinium_polyedra.AAC.1
MFFQQLIETIWESGVVDQLIRGTSGNEPLSRYQVVVLDDLVRQLHTLRPATKDRLNPRWSEIVED